MDNVDLPTRANIFLKTKRMHGPFDDPLPPETFDDYDGHRIAPYLLRYYASVCNPRASMLSNRIFDALIGQIIWPRGSLRRATAAKKAHGHPASGELPEFLGGTEFDDDDLELRAAPTNEVDAKLAQLGDFTLALKLLYADDPAWLRRVLHNSLPAAKARQNEGDRMMWTRLQQVGEVFGWTQGELELARIAMHAGDIAELAEWL